jgi:hypothetical protein
MSDKTIEQQAEEINVEMAKGSWNDSTEIIAGMLRELEAARKVADAAVVVLEWLWGEGWVQKDGRTLFHGRSPILCDLLDAVHKYRKLTTPPPLEARIAAAVERVLGDADNE